MIELYLKGDDICSFQANNIELLKKDVADYVYYNGEKDVIRIEQVDEDGATLRCFSPIELLEFEYEVNHLAADKRKSDKEFLGTIKAAQDSLGLYHY